MKQKDNVIEAMRINGGYATFQQLNTLVDFSAWKTRTPFASIRRIVQTNSEFFRIQPGLWALKECEKEVLEKFRIDAKDKESVQEFTHSYFQGIIVEIGNMRNLDTYVPAQDKNKLFLERKLCEIATTNTIYDFTYPEILRKAKTVDTIWFNERKMPCAFYEVEHSTNIRNSLDKFYELQDFRAKFYIVAAHERKNQFEDIMSNSIYRPIKNLVDFVNYDSLIAQYNAEHNLAERVI
ncbi:MAG: hypothetical protein E7218_00755 [Anaerofustis stercorihominis]|nr:hypothetical protein [Anaerofustis stercorihominis]